MNNKIFTEKLINAYSNNADKGIKHIEIAFQRVIEKAYPNKCWWQVCKVSIFNRMFVDKVNPLTVIDEIVQSCNKYIEE